MGEQPILAPSSRLPTTILVGLLLLGTAPEPLGANPPTTRITWRAVCVDPVFRSEGVALADVNRDGKTDVLVGPAWYEAPDWKMHEIHELGDHGDGSKSYSTSFSCYAEDVNQDSWVDLIVFGSPDSPCHWYENSQGRPGHWKKHLIVQVARNETPLHVDLFGNGKKVLVMGWLSAGKKRESHMAWFRPGKDPTQPWEIHSISGPGKGVPGMSGHGLGTGDVNGDGRLDVICINGWWEQPEKDDGEPWKFHAVNIGEDCANMYTADVDGDGDADVISSSAHKYGIWWHEQKAEKGHSRFVRHDFFKNLLSQTHALHFQDIDGDGLKDLVTGKRWWAHGPRGDPGSEQPAALYWFQARRKKDGSLGFTPHLIHDNSGVGTQFAVGDFNGDDLLDVVTANKKGVHMFEQVPVSP